MPCKHQTIVIVLVKIPQDAWISEQRNVSNSSCDGWASSQMVARPSKPLDSLPTYQATGSVSPAAPTPVSPSPAAAARSCPPSRRERCAAAASRQSGAGRVLRAAVK
jgi:hypothetical protein